MGFEAWLEQHDKTISFGLTIGGGLVGWLLYMHELLQKKRLTLTIASEGGDIYLCNHSTEAIELVHGSVSLRDLGSAPDLAKKAQFMLGRHVVIQATERAKIMDIGPDIVKAIEEVCAPAMRATAARYPEFNFATQPRTCFAEFHLSVKKVGTSKLRHVYFERMIGGHADLGWGMSYAPYAHDTRNSLPNRLRRALLYVRHPLDAWERHKALDDAQLRMTLFGIANAMQEGVLTEDQVQARVEKLLKHKKDPVAFLEEVMSDPDETRYKIFKAVADSRNAEYGTRKKK